MTRLALFCCALIAGLTAVAAPALAATGAPIVATNKASNLTPQAATVSGTVNPHGHPTSYYFEFGKTTGYGARTQTGNLAGGSSSVPVSATLTGLEPNTTYHFRLVGFNTAGTSRSSDRTFKTPQIPTTSTIAVSPNPIPFGGVMLVSGFLSGPDVGGKRVSLQANAFPFTGGFQQVGNTVLTSSQGGYTFLTPAVIDSQLRVVDLDKPSVTSPTVLSNVAYKPTFGLRKSRSVTGRVKFFGHVAPARAGNTVQIQRATSKGWKNVGLTLTKAKTATYAGYARTIRLHKSGTFRALVRATGGDYVDGPSRTLRLRIR